MKRKIAIAPNVYLVDRDGALSYMVRWQRDGKCIERTIGKPRQLTERQAIIAAHAIMANYRPPMNDADNITFAEVAGLALNDIEQVKNWKNDSSRKQWEQTINDYAIPLIGNVKIADLSREDVLGVLRPLWREKTETASRLRMRIEAIVNWAIRNDLRTAANPAVWRGNLEFDLPRMSKVHAVEHHGAMTLEEARHAVDYCLSHASPVSAAILLGLSTATRVQEFRLAKAEEFDGPVWAIPPERRKDTKPVPFYVPLSELAREAVAMGNAEGFLFTSKNGVIAADSPRLKLIEIIGRRVTMHGCRSTFRDWAASAGIDHIVAEKCLMHQTGNAVEQAYQRSDLFDQRCEVMNHWSDVLTASSAAVC